MSCLPEDVRALALLLPETIEGAQRLHLVLFLNSVVYWVVV